MNDFRFAVRSLRRSPTLAITVVLTLALCIGATSAVFSVVYAVLFRPLPFKDPNGLMLFTEVWKGQPGGSVSVGNWADAKREDRLFEHLVPMSGASVNLAGSDLPENVTGARVGWDFFQLLGVPPALGRAFLPEEDRPGSDGVVILSDGLWRRRFGADRSVIGREIRIDAVPRQVIGVMPASLDYTLYGEELWLPAAFTPTQLAEHDEHYLTVLGRLKPAVHVVGNPAHCVDDFAPRAVVDRQAKRQAGVAGGHFDRAVHFSQARLGNAVATADHRQPDLLAQKRHPLFDEVLLVQFRERCVSNTLIVAEFLP